MNKENGIKRLNRLSVKAKEYRDENTQVVKLSQAIEVIELIDQLDEPEKPVVPQFVADEIERYDCMLDMLFGEYFNNSEEEIDNNRLFLWIDENQDTLARAWLDGYEVEKEPRFLMPVPYQKSDQVYYCGVGKNIKTKWSADKYWHHKYTQEELDKYFPEIKHMAEEVQE